MYGCHLCLGSVVWVQVCWLPRPLSQADVALLAATKELEVQQETPIRVGGGWPAPVERLGLQALDAGACGRSLSTSASAVQSKMDWSDFSDVFSEPLPLACLACLSGAAPPRQPVPPQGSACYS